jgi:Fe-S cluster biogenesis protein NfuA
MREIFVDRSSAEMVIARVRPAIQADGGDIELVDVDGPDLRIRLLGKCIGCPSSERTLRDGLEVRLRREIPGFGRIIAVS